MASFTMDGTTIFSKTGNDITYANGTLGSGTIFPSGHIIQMNQTIDQSFTSRGGDKTAWASTGVSCALPNSLKTNSKLFVTYSAVVGEDGGGHWAISTLMTIFQNGSNVCGTHLTNLNATYGLSQTGPDNSGNQYFRGTHSASALFTPQGTGAAQRTVELYWSSPVVNSYTVYLNTAGNTSVAYDGGATILTVMEIAQ